MGEGINLSHSSIFSNTKAAGRGVLTTFESIRYGKFWGPLVTSTKTQVCGLACILGPSSPYYQES